MGKPYRPPLSFWIPLQIFQFSFSFFSSFWIFNLQFDLFLLTSWLFFIAILIFLNVRFYFFIVLLNLFRHFAFFFHQFDFFSSFRIFLLWFPSIYFANLLNIFYLYFIYSASLRHLFFFYCVAHIMLCTPDFEVEINIFKFTFINHSQRIIKNKCRCLLACWDVNWFSTHATPSWANFSRYWTLLQISSVSDVGQK